MRFARPDMIDTILLGDCVAGMREIKTGSVDLIFADPPYNLQLNEGLVRPDESEVKGVHEEWDRFDSLEDYDEFNREWLAEARRILSPNGAIWTIGSYHNVFRLGTVLQDTGFWILNDVVWVKSNPMPNFRGRRLTNAHETLIWASRDKGSRYRFNYEIAKAANDDTQMRSDWSFPICGGNERLREDDGVSVHPTQKPEALISRILSVCTLPGDVVLDPFSGSGTTCAVAKRMRRHWIGIERDPTYHARSVARVDAVVPYAEDAIAIPVSRREATKIPFSALVDGTLVDPGADLFDPTGTHSAIVRPDGNLDLAGEVMSIHKAAAKLKGMKAFNGWDYWHVRGEDGLVSIDVLRAKARTMMVPSSSAG